MKSTIMEYGVFTSSLLEVAQTRHWALCFYCNEDKSVIGAELYNGVEDKKTLAAVCRRDRKENKTVYAYETIGDQKFSDQKFSNDFEGVCKLLRKPFAYNVSELKKIDTIEITEPYIMPTVSEQGIANCLKQWRMGAVYRPIYDGMLFQMVTNKIEYVFSIQNSECNIYCGASVNIPYDEGMFGGVQYFRIRNYADNSAPYCGFECSIGMPIDQKEVKKIQCESGKCASTPDGLYWPVKRYDEEEIVLAGCGGDEYIYNRNQEKSEYFKYFKSV